MILDYQGICKLFQITSPESLPEEQISEILDFDAEDSENF